MEANLTKNQKAKDVEKSLVVLEVKPWDETVNLVELWCNITQYQQEGLVWGETYKLEPVVAEINKLILTCTIVDSMVLLDDITENIESMEDYVQSVDIVSMNKL
jgi:elongation factor 1-beta